MKLGELIKTVSVVEVCGGDDMEVTGIEIDSRKVAPGHLFVAVKGSLTDGHAYIEKAIKAGAVAVLCEEMPTTLNEKVVYVKALDTEKLVGPLASRFYGEPTGKMKLVGVTGTNGKTTIATLLYKLFLKLGHRVGLISTVCNYVNEEAYPTTHTTPDAITLNKLLHKMASAGLEYVFMEVSSHSVVQHRIGGLCFAGGIFTNLTRDHLDYHKTFDNYLRAKKEFFDHLPKDAFALTNYDDKHGKVMLQNTMAHSVAGYSLERVCEFKGRVLEDHLNGMLLEVDGAEVAVHFTGRFNASNLLAVYAGARLLGKSKMEVLEVLSMLTPVEGRFEQIFSDKGFTAIVDYAHTPDALANVLDTIKSVQAGKSGEIITVVGAGGNRDKGKRPLMAHEAVLRSDKVIITSDNPRDENPTDIIADMMAGVEESERNKVLQIVDRRTAIQTACLLAKKGDVILVAGKGHEKYQEVAGVRHHFDDKEVLQEYMS